MVNFIVLLLISVIVMQDVEVLKGLKDWIINKQWEEGKVAVPLSIIIGIIAGVTVNIGITDSILKMFDVDFVLPKYYMYFDIASTCLFLSKGSGFFIDTLNKFKEARGQVNLDKQTK